MATNPPVEYKVVKIGNQVTPSIQYVFNLMGSAGWVFVTTIGSPGAEQALFQRNL